MNRREAPWYAELREQWKPDPVRVLLVAESDPDPGTTDRRFFCEARRPLTGHVRHLPHIGYQSDPVWKLNAEMDGCLRRLRRMQRPTSGTRTPHACKRRKVSGGCSRALIRSCSNSADHDAMRRVLASDSPRTMRSGAVIRTTAELQAEARAMLAKLTRTRQSLTTHWRRYDAASSSAAGAPGMEPCCGGAERSWRAGPSPPPERRSRARGRRSRRPRSRLRRRPRSRSRQRVGSRHARTRSTATRRCAPRTDEFPITSRSFRPSAAVMSSRPARSGRLRCAVCKVGGRVPACSLSGCERTPRAGEDRCARHRACVEDGCSRTPHKDTARCWPDTVKLEAAVDVRRRNWYLIGTRPSYGERHQNARKPPGERRLSNRPLSAFARRRVAPGFSTGRQ